MQCLSILLICAIVMGAQCEAKSQGASPPLSPKNTTSDIGDALLDAAKKNSINFIADASQFSEEKPNNKFTSAKQGPKPVESQYGLTSLTQGQILLFWKQPDVRQLAQKIIAGDTIKILSLKPTSDQIPLALIQPEHASALTTDQSPSANQSLLQKVFDYFHEKHGFDENTPHSVREMKVSKLPPQLHDQIVAVTQVNMLGSEPLELWKVWFSDEFWNKAQMRVVEESGASSTAPKVPVLTVGGTVDFSNATGGSMMSLGQLKTKSNK